MAARRLPQPGAVANHKFTLGCRLHSELWLAEESFSRVASANQLAVNVGSEQCNTKLSEGPHVGLELQATRPAPGAGQNSVAIDELEERHVGEIVMKQCGEQAEAAPEQLRACFVLTDALR